MKSKKLGPKAENHAKKLLLNKGYHFVTQNYRTHFGEIDLIFIDNEETVFVEVKARRSSGKGLPEEAVTPKKLKTIIRVAQSFLQKYSNLPQRARVDVVAIQNQPNFSIRHLKSVTG